MQAITMQPRLTALSLLLRALGVPPNIGTQGDRKLIQKAVYLAQRGAVDLGYRYGWYRFGPYSPALTEDYYALENARRVGESTNGHEFKGEILDGLARLRPLLTPPPGFPFGGPEWLELLASVDFLIKLRKITDRAQLDGEIARLKEPLAPYVACAVSSFESVGWTF